MAVACDGLGSGAAHGVEGLLGIGGGGGGGGIGAREVRATGCSRPPVHLFYLRASTSLCDTTPDLAVAKVTDIERAYPTYPIMGCRTRSENVHDPSLAPLRLYVGEATYAVSTHIQVHTSTSVRVPKRGGPHPRAFRRWACTPHLEAAIRFVPRVRSIGLCVLQRPVLFWCPPSRLANIIPETRRGGCKCWWSREDMVCGSKTAGAALAFKASMHAPSCSRSTHSKVMVAW